MISRGLGSCLVLVWSLFGVSGPAIAQTGTGVSVESEAGVAGYVEPNTPVAVTVTVEADVLFSGRIELVVAGSRVSVPAEVPAGSVKTYTLIGAPVNAGGILKVRLFPEGETDPLMSTNVTTRLPAEDRVLVGVAGVDGLAGTLARLRTDIGALPVEPVEITNLDRTLDPLGYLVVSDPASVTPAVADWVEDGGRLLLESGGAEGLDPAVEPLGTYPGTMIDWYRWGGGEVLAVPDFSTAPWTILIRPAPLGLGSSAGWNSPNQSLMTAAANGGDQRIPSLPWLLGAVLGYAVVVGPITFILLSRIRRRELAWVVVPVLSMVAVAGFWVAGRQRLEEIETSHASVVIAHAGTLGTAEMRSAVVLAAGRSGRYRLGFDQARALYPATVTNQFQPGDPGAGVLALGSADGSDVTFELPQLGFAGAVLHTTVEEFPEIAAARDGDSLSVTVDNDTTLEFEPWGVSDQGTAAIAPAVLAPGAEGEFAVKADNAFMMTIGDAAGQRITDDRSWQTYYPLGEAVALLLPTTRSFFFGYTDDLAVAADVHGEPRRIAGISVVVVPIDITAESSLGRAQAEFVSAPDSAFIERGPNYFMVQSSEMTVSFQVPVGVEGDVTLEFSDFFGFRPAGYQAWDWVAGSFQEVELGVIDRSRFEAGNGELVLRVIGQEPGGDEFIEPASLSPLSLSIAWEPNA